MSALISMRVILDFLSHCIDLPLLFDDASHCITCFWAPSVESQEVLKAQSLSERTLVHHDKWFLCKAYKKRNKNYIYMYPLVLFNKRKENAYLAVMCAWCQHDLFKINWFAEGKESPPVERSSMLLLYWRAWKRGRGFITPSYYSPEQHYLKDILIDKVDVIHTYSLRLFAQRWI